MQPESDKFETAKAIAGKLMEALNHKGLEITDEEHEWMRRVSLALLSPAALPALCDQIFLAYIDDTGCKYLGQEWDDEAEDFLEQVGYILDEESYLHEENNEVDELMGNEPVLEWTEEDEKAWQETLAWDKWDEDE